MCLACGFYKGRVVIDMKAKSDARAARLAAKQEAIAQNAAAEPAPVEGPAEEENHDKEADQTQK